MKISPFKFFVAVFTLLTLIIVLGFSNALYEHHRLASFMRQFVSLQLGRATLSDVQKLAAKYDGTLSGIHLQDRCTVQDCAVGFLFKNWVFNHLQDHQEISLAAGVIIKNNQVTSKELDYSIFATPTDHQFVYVLFDRLEDLKGYTVRQQRVNMQGVAHEVEINMGINAPEELRKRAYAVDLACLTRIFGCRSPNDILPNGLVWNRLDEFGGQPGI